VSLREKRFLNAALQVIGSGRFARIRELIHKPPADRFFDFMGEWFAIITG
jgi:hypothetical protein